jgi:hypothetical protein
MAVRDDFTAGEVLAAADLNDTFASKPPFAYGTATPTTTVEGFIWYDENDTPPTAKFWDGSAFQDISAPGGLVHINTTTLSGSATNINNVFTADYDNYRIIYDYLPSQATTVGMKMRASGSDVSTGYYYNINAQSADNLHSVANNTSQFAIQWSNSSTRCFTIIDLLNPFLALNTFFNSVNWRDNQQSLASAGVLDTTSYDGFSIIPGAGTITGTVRIYGYKN